MKPSLQSMCPFFIVSNVTRSIAFYRDQLGFALQHQQPAHDPFFAILARDAAMLFLKSGRVTATPNPTRDPDMRWDAYVLVDDPATLAGEWIARGVSLSQPLVETDDGLHGFELTDPDGYVLFFGYPR